MYIPKRILFFVLSIVSPYILEAKGLNYPKFLETTGMELVAAIAHPVAYKSGLFIAKESKCVIFHNEFYYVLQFVGGSTIVHFKQENGIIVSVNLHSTSFEYSVPFAAIELLLMIYNEDEIGLNQDPIWNRVLKYYSSEFEKQFSQFNGYELVITSLAYKWEVELANEEKDNKTNNKPTVHTLGQITRNIDGIKVVGTPEFTRKVEESLNIIEDYDKYTYDNYFKNTTYKFNLVKAITYNDILLPYSTTSENGVINLSSSLGYFHHDDIFKSNSYELAATLIHEMTHLYQQYEYSKLYNSPISGWKKSFAYDPIENAEIEQNAYDVSLIFLNKILEKVPPDGNLFIRTAVSNTIKGNELLKGYYNTLIEAGTYLFESHSDNPSCGNSCMLLFEAKLRLFGSKHKAFKGTVEYLTWLYL